MQQLIRKGGFRERANRSSRYSTSENQLTTLKNYQYCSNTQIVSDAPSNLQPKSLNHPDDKNSESID